MGMQRERLVGMVLAALTLAGCWPELPNEIYWDEWPDDVVDRLAKEAPLRCDSHPRFESPGSRPYEVTEQRLMAGAGSGCSLLGERVAGTDLGVSVHFDGERSDLIYFGDTTLPEPDDLKPGPEFFLRHECAYKAHPRCNDAFATIDDDDPDDGVDVSIQATKWAQLNRRDVIDSWTDGFGSIRLLGLNAWDLDGELISAEEGDDVFGEYDAPSGAMAITAYRDGGDELFDYGRRRLGEADLEEVPGVLMCFATANADLEKKQSWLGCSADGVTFRSCTHPREKRVTRLSKDRFIQVAPVPFSRDDVEEACAADPGGVLCGLDEVVGDFRPEYTQGALLFGNGARYRCSPLYLGYLELVTGDVWYLGGDGEWTEKESKAAAIIEPGWSGFDPEAESACPEGRGDRIYDDRENIFGEVSVKLLGSHFVMLSNHFEYSAEGEGYVRVYYRTAPRERPDAWSEAEATEGVGYGPFILDRYTVAPEGGPELELYHTLSTWNPSLSPEGPYAVVTKELRLLETGEPPPWPPVE